MIYRTDSHFVIGSTHDVCQDYTCSGVTDSGIVYAIVSDGCSESKDSDLGSRILVSSAESLIDMIAESISVMDSHLAITRMLETMIKQKIIAVKSALDLPLSTFYATLLVAVIYDNKLYLYARGDGSISIKLMNLTGEISHIINQIKYESSAPYYLAYDIVPHIKEIYQRDHIGKYLEHIHFINNPPTTTCVERENTYVFSNIIDLTDKKLMHLSLSSDGLESYMTIPGQPVIASTDFITQSLRTTAFKNNSDGFVHRRVNRMELEDKKSMVQHSDDISIASIISVDEVSNG